MGSPLDVKLIPLKYPERFKWGYFQKIRLFLSNLLLDEAIVIRSLEIEQQLPLRLAWYGSSAGSLVFLDNENIYLHHLMASGETPAIFAWGLIMPGNKLRLTMGMRMHSEQQRLAVSFHRIPMSFLREKSFWQLTPYHPLVARYGLPDKSRERAYGSVSSLPEHFKSRRVILPDLDQFTLQQHNIISLLELGNLHEKSRIEKVTDTQGVPFYYYCNPLKQWFIRNDTLLLHVKKKHGKLCPIEMPPFDFRLFDAMEANEQNEAIVCIEHGLAPVLQHYGIDVQGNYAYIRASTLLDALDVMKLNENDLSLRNGNEKPGIVFSLQSKNAF
jgi:hypothetical protein